MVKYFIVRPISIVIWRTCQLFASVASEGHAYVHRSN